MRILVTGGAGFIGSHLTDRFLDLDKEVVGFAVLSGLGRMILPFSSTTDRAMVELPTFDPTQAQSSPHMRVLARS